jgi:ribosome-binding factor A
MEDSRRKERVNVLLRQLLSEIISRDMKDPRLAQVITLVHVSVSKDLRYAKVFTSVLGTPEENKSAVETLNAASAFMRRELMSRISLKTVPVLSFVEDNSIEKGTRVLDRIAEVISSEPSKETHYDG